MSELLKPKTGILAGNILYSDILAVLDNDSDRKLIEQYLNYPSEQQFISEWLFALKDLGKFWNFFLEYEEPLSIYPEELYKKCKFFLYINENNMIMVFYVLCSMFLSFLIFCHPTFLYCKSYATSTECLTDFNLTFTVVIRS